jgi:hypothetical protein
MMEKVEESYAFKVWQEHPDGGIYIYLVLDWIGLD